MMELVSRSGRDMTAMILAAGVMFASFAIAHVCAIAFPPVDGKAQQITALTGKICLLILVVFALWFVVSAYDYMKLADFWSKPAG